MGTWGTGLYSDDRAADVRGVYRGLKKLGVFGHELCELLLAQFSLEDQAEPVFWLVLADLLWTDGMLDDEIKRRALEVIDSGSDLAL